MAAVASSSAYGGGHRAQAADLNDEESYHERRVRRPSPSYGSYEARPPQERQRDSGWAARDPSQRRQTPERELGNGGGGGANYQGNGGNLRRNNWSGSANGRGADYFAE